MLFAERAHRAGLDFVCSYPAGVQAGFRGDPDRLRQVLTNLVGNALKFTRRGEVIVRVIIQSEDEHDVLLRFEVQDSGVGIAPEHQGHIFDSFAQADGSTTRRFGGTGLGLSICKKLTGLMGGDIGVDSTSGKGSTFWFTCPMPKEARVGSARLRAGARSLAGRHILVIEDNDTNREIVTEQLQAWGASITAVQSIAEGKLMLKQMAAGRENYDVLILDRRLPDGDGVELARRINRHKALRHLKIVLLSSVGHLEDTGQWLMSGVHAYLNKPVRQKDLFECLAVALELENNHLGDTAPMDPEAAGGHARRFTARVLVAEDNEVNQELARSMLESVGAHVTIVPNGREAVEAIADSPLDDVNDPYALILMDCQMPELDGYAATAAIRAFEARAGRPRLPIVALTANALEGDRERCLEAEMDDYISKPFTRDQLVEVLERWLPIANSEVGVRREEALARQKSQARPARLPAAQLDAGAIARVRALQQPGGPDVLARIVDIFLSSSPGIVAAIRAAADAGDAAALRQAAHKLKSSSANLGGNSLSEICRQLEAAGAAGAVADAVAMLDVLEFEYEAVERALRAEVNKIAAA